MVSWLWTLDVIDNGFTSLGEWCDGQDPILSIAQRSCSSFARTLPMSSISSFYHQPKTHRSGPPTRDLLVLTLTIGISIPSSISLPASLFTRSITHHPVINSLVTLCTLWWCPTEWAQRYLSINRSDKSHSRFVPTQQTLSEILVVHLYSHPVTLWRLAHPKHSYGIRELHDLMV